MNHKLYMPLNIDWALLRRQKQCLLSMARDPRPTDEAEALAGIVHLLDGLQDEAVAKRTATEVEVFGKGN